MRKFRRHCLPNDWHGAVIRQRVSGFRYREEASDMPHYLTRMLVVVPRD